MIAALKRTRLYQRYRRARTRRRQRSHKGLARSLERLLVNDDAVLRALTHLVERAGEQASAAERDAGDLRTRIERLEQLVAEQRDQLAGLADRFDRSIGCQEPGPGDP